jgi:prepilin-type N-terminal cleavage/methylation domain-containing protein
MQKTEKNWFTLMEIMMGILILSMIILGALYGMSSINIGKVRLIESTNLEKEAFFLSETLFDFIKKWGLVDYEEYFNRKNVNYGQSVVNTYDGGNYKIDTGFWNNSSTLVYCISKAWSKMYPRTGSGCLDDFNTSTGVTTGTPIYNASYFWNPLLYWQYAYQFIDFNSDADNNKGDENGDGKIVRDDDDQYIGNGPWVFDPNGKVYEIYLLSGDGKKRTILRWEVGIDPNAPSSASACTGLTWIPTSITWDKCLGTLKYLKLEWMDWWYDHNVSTVDPTQFDGIIDTWIYDKETYGLSTDIIAKNSTPWNDKYRTPLFPNTMNVKMVKLFLYPYKDSRLSWKDSSSWVNINPYLRFDISLTPSRKKRKAIKGAPPVFHYSTSISLTDIFSK